MARLLKGAKDFLYREPWLALSVGFGVTGLALVPFSNRAPYIKFHPESDMFQGPGQERYNLPSFNFFRTDVNMPEFRMERLADEVEASLEHYLAIERKAARPMNQVDPEMLRELFTLRMERSNPQLAEELKRRAAARQKAT